MLTRRALAATFLGAAAVLAADTAAGSRPKVVILGFDGADARLVERWMSEGKLPNLARLRDEGAYTPLQPTNPPQTPVSWSSFATGTTPGKTKIFDWLVRDPATYLPDVGMVVESRRPFLMGSKNGLAAGLMVAVPLFALTVLVLGFLKLSLRLRVVVAAALGAAAAVPAGIYTSKMLPVEVPAINRRTGAPITAAAKAD
jgi:hypothetical protein